MRGDTLNKLNGVPALLPPEVLDQLCDMIIARLQARNFGDIPSRQVVAGSSPISRPHRPVKSVPNMNSLRKWPCVAVARQKVDMGIPPPPRWDVNNQHAVLFNTTIRF